LERFVLGGAAPRTPGDPDSHSHSRQRVLGQWLPLCWEAYFSMTASVFGLMHVAAEVLVVGGLAMLEWSQRDRLRFAL
jgi:hypothetical protein